MSKQTLEDRLLGNRLLKDLTLYLPFTRWDIAWRVLDKQAQSILDVGCGKGTPMMCINRHKDVINVGADISLPYIQQSKARRSHDDYVLCDIRNLPFQRKSFDVVLCMDVIEHLEKEEAKKVIDEIEQICKKQVVITTPNGLTPGCHTLIQDSQYQIHKSGWTPAELKALGYKVRGFGLHILLKTEWLTDPPKILAPLRYILWSAGTLFSYFFVKIAGDIVASKKLKAVAK